MKSRGIYGNVLNITQTAHGTQDGKALDSNSPLIAMEDVYVYDYHHIVQWHPKINRNTEQQSYFYVRMYNSNDYFIVVHAFPLKMGLVKAGEEVGKMHWYWNWETGARADHFHTCANIAGVGWVEPPCILDPNVVQLKWAYGGDNWSAHYENYRNLSINTLTTEDMVTSFPTTCKVLYNDTLVRPEPNRNKPPVKTLSSGTAVTVTAYATGEDVNGGNIWCYIGDGYVHKSLITPDDSLQKEVDTLNKQIETQRLFIAEQDAQIDTLEGQIVNLNNQIAENEAKIKILEKDVSRVSLLLEQAQNELKICSEGNQALQKEVDELKKGCKNIIEVLADFIKKIFEWIGSKLR
jgi:archaellum component FlaC